MPVHGTHARVLLIFWMYGTAMGRNTAFVSGVEKRLDRKSVILPLGRSGKHSAGEAEMLTVAGFENVFNVLDGFEGDLDGNMRRNQVNAWRYRESSRVSGRNVCMVTGLRFVSCSNFCSVIREGFFPSLLFCKRPVSCFLSCVLLFSSLHE